MSLQKKVLTRYTAQTATLCSLYFSLVSFASAQTTTLGPASITGVAGVSFSTMAIGIRFFGALWASVGLAYFVWGLTDYMLSHGNAHHKAEGQAKISKGFSILVGFTIAWAITKVVTHFIFG